MKIERLVVISFFVGGILGGVASNYFSLLGNLHLAFILPSVIYMIILLPFLKLARRKGVSWTASNTLVTFILIWLVTWFALYAM